MTKHTPGPWHYCAEDKFNPLRAFGINRNLSPDQTGTDEPGTETVAEVCDGPTAEADAKLIAAAPDLLAALEPVAKEIKDKCADLQHPSWDTDHHREITLTIGECRAILAALKKAGGAP